jgi:hypothetical protein
MDVGKNCNLGGCGRTAFKGFYYVLILTREVLLSMSLRNKFMCRFLRGSCILLSTSSRICIGCWRLACVVKHGDKGCRKPVTCRTHFTSIEDLPTTSLTQLSLTTACLTTLTLAVGARYGRRYQDMLRGWEEQRAASAAAFAAKSRLAYEAAGGEALGKRMEEQVCYLLHTDFCRTEPWPGALMTDSYRGAFFYF